MTISNSTLYTDVWNTIRTILVSTPIYVTISTTSETTAASIVAEYNDKSPSRPQIVLHSMDKSEDGYFFGGNEGKKLIDVTVDCYYSNSLGMDQLSEQVENLVKNNVITEMELVGITTDTAFTNPNTTKYQFKTIVFTYDKE